MIIISACLLGINCKYNGENNLNKNILEIYKKKNCIPVCPEQLGGLSTPRLPSEIKNKNVYNIEGKDVTNNFIKGSQEALKLGMLKKCKIAILKSKSPSCGTKQIYDGSFKGRLKSGKGFFAELLEKNDIKTINSDEKEKIDKIIT